MLLLFQSMDISLGDLMGLDDLYRHARMHMTEQGDSLGAFLIMHYGRDGIDHRHERSGEENPHEKLPFQQLGSPAAWVCILSRSDANVPQWTCSPAIRSLNPSFYENFYHHIQLTNIFQPPRLS